MKKYLGAGSAGIPLPIKIIHYSQPANVQVQSVTFTSSVFAAGWTSKNKLKIAIASSLTIGNLSNVKFAGRPIPWF